MLSNALLSPVIPRDFKQHVLPFFHAEALAKIKYDPIRTPFDAMRQQRAVANNPTWPWGNGPFATLHGQIAGVDLNPELAPRFASRLGEEPPGSCR